MLSHDEDNVSFQSLFNLCINTTWPTVVKIATVHAVSGRRQVAGVMMPTVDGHASGSPVDLGHMTSEQPSRKRKLTSLSAASFPRKRSFTACQLCRNRKTKCDNKRPECSKCIELKATCIYQDEEQAGSDPTSRILERLEYLIELVEGNQGVLEHNDALDWNPDTQPHEHGFPQVPQEELSPGAVRNPMYSNASVSHLRFDSCESILEWPVFEGRYDRRNIEALIFDPTLVGHDPNSPLTSPKITDDSIRDSFEDPRHMNSIGRGVVEEDVPRLIEVFLANVHTKNPILDPAYLRNMARCVSEDGFDWKASSCLVLMACALAVLSAPFTLRSIHNDSNSSTDSLSNTPDYYTAEAYYTASRKRMGLLTNNLLATECYFLCGIYEMYSLRPLRASISFNRACVAFQALTWMRSEYYIAERGFAKARASRLFWSCLKSEHEISVELRVPSSGLHTLNYTTSFPAPPVARLTEQLYEASRDTSPLLQDEYEKCWYYYLADIAARRILQRVVDSLYTGPNSPWLTAPLTDLIETAQELARQLTQWYTTLPTQISFPLTHPPPEELSFHLQARLAELKERIHRPFLFILLHKPLSPHEHARTAPFVTAHIASCLALINQWNLCHRHHGTWLMVRQSFASALLICAAKRAGVLAMGGGGGGGGVGGGGIGGGGAGSGGAGSGEEQQQLADAERAVRVCVRTMRYWEAEAPDLGASRKILEDVIERSFGVGVEVEEGAGEGMSGGRGAQEL